MVVFRAVENRMAFARAANTGVSGLIDPTGRIVTATPIFTEHAIIGSIPLSGTLDGDIHDLAMCLRGPVL